MKLKLKLLKIFLGLAVFIFLLSFSANRYANKKLETMEIAIDREEGRKFLNDSLVLTILNHKNYPTERLAMGAIQVDYLESLLNANPFVEHAKVFKSVDGALKVDIEQKKPILRINNGVDEEYYLGEDLTKIPLSNLYAVKVMMVGGAIDSADYVGLKDLSEIVMADKLLKKHIIAVKKQAPNSFNLLVNKGDYIIEFGALDNIEEKFDNLKLFYEQYLGKVGLSYYEKINLKFNNQIVATKRVSDEK